MFFLPPPQVSSLLRQSLSPFFFTPRVDPPRKSAKSTMVWPPAEGVPVPPIQPKPRPRSDGTWGSSSWSLHDRHFMFKKKNYYPLWICLQNEDHGSCSSWLLLRAVFSSTCVFINSRAPCHWGRPSPLVPSSLSSPLPTCRTSWSLQYFPHMYIQFPSTING